MSTAAKITEIEYLKGLLDAKEIVIAEGLTIKFTRTQLKAINKHIDRLIAEVKEAVSEL